MAQKDLLQRLLDDGERELVAATHYPELCDLSDEDLSGLQRNLRDRRNRARDIARRQRREMRGKASPAGARAASDDAGTREKLSLLSSAVQRTNKEAARRRRFSAKANLKENAQKALDMRRARMRRNHPSAGRTSNSGMKAISKQKGPDLSNGMEAGRVSQFVKQGQVRRDSH